MDWLRIARAASGTAAILALLGLVMMGWYLERPVDTGTILLLLGVASTMLGVDMITDKVPITVTYEKGGSGGDGGG